MSSPIVPPDTAPGEVKDFQVEFLDRRNSGDDETKEENGSEEQVKASTEAPEFDFPDGGLRAWLVVLGAALCSTVSFGYVNSWGVFQAYYEKTLLQHLSPSTIAWIGSIQYSLVLLPALPVGRLFDLGYFRKPFLASSIVLVVGVFLTGQCTQYWQFMLCQGILQGLACGCVYAPTNAVIGHWFKKNRGRAMGLMAVGSSVGGATFPIAAKRLIVQVGFPWTMRILGFILLVCLAVPNLALKRRLPPKNVKGGLFNWAAFKDPAFSYWTLSCLFTFLGLYTVLTYIDVAATKMGVSEDFSFYLVAIANASSGFGRLGTSFLVDKIGPINFLLPTTLIAGIATYAWPFAHSLASLITVAVIYGFTCGTYVSAFLLPLYEMGEIQEIGRRTGMVMSIGALGALTGPPISGAINHATGGFEAVGYFAGSVVVVAALFMMATRQLILKKAWGKI
ncbi:hypothetical protein PQX77_015678 [Marasmius sp. AFHP31]|nr:hypothetical protein PQX77_015678 [Marasmius sp. AFHP31]